MFTVLVVDDEPDLRFLLRRIFEGAGYAVIEAGHGVAALAALGESLPDLVVTDVMMPVMDGVELIRRLRADPVTLGIPILAVSGHSQLAIEADAVIHKPFRPAQVLTLASTLLATSGT